MHYLVYHLSSPTPDLQLLSPADLDTTEQAAYARRGERYLRERTLLKRELERLCGIPAREIRFSYSPEGKPEFAAQSFNISHSGDLLCMAFHHLAVGVDIERMRERPHLAALARRIMCPEQLAAWQTRGCPLDEFYACWCAAEALVKLHGGSIWHALQYPFLYRHGGITPLMETAPVVEIFHPEADYLGAVAYYL